MGPRGVVLVEGPSDQAAVLALAASFCLPLDQAGVTVITMGGITNLYQHLVQYSTAPDTALIGGLYDAAEEGVVQGATARLGWGDALTREQLAAHGLFACDPDLEGELIRALGPPAVLDLIQSENELGGFRTFQRQPAQRERPLVDQLHRFAGIRSGRKIRYGGLLTERLDPGILPAPLAGLVKLLQQFITRQEL